MRGRRVIAYTHGREEFDAGHAKNGGVGKNTVASVDGECSRTETTRRSSATRNKLEEKSAIPVKRIPGKGRYARYGIKKKKRKE